MREKLHPVGKKDIRKVQYNENIVFEVDIGDRLGCEFYYGFYSEIFESKLFIDILTPASILYDVGSNFGFYAINTANKMREIGGHVYAFEPNTDAFKLMLNNIETNKLTDIVDPYNKCIGNYDGTVEFYICEESSFSGIKDTGRSNIREKIKIPIAKIDTLCTKWHVQQIDFLKIDVEGEEYQVLNGAKQIIEASQNLLIMMEISQKNLKLQNRKELYDSLAWLYAVGMKGWIAEFGHDDLVAIDDPDSAIMLEGANLFFAYKGSDSEIKLKKTYNNLVNQIKSHNAEFNNDTNEQKSIVTLNNSLKQLYISTIKRLRRKCEELLDEIKDRDMLINGYNEKRKEYIDQIKKRDKLINDFNEKRKTYIDEIKKRDKMLIESKKRLNNIGPKRN
jgi:FkbM family methyltransferase